MSESNAADDKKLTRRGFIRWTTALGVVAVAVVGIGVGYGAELLTRPSATTTATATQTSTATSTATMTQTATQTTTAISTQTETATTTVTAPAPTLSYVPPLSSSVQANVNTIIQNLVNSHQAEVQSYWASPNYNFTDLYKVVTNNGNIVGIVPEDILDSNIAREDAYLPATDIWADKGTRGIPGELDFASLYYVNTPDRILYPMKRVGARADPNGQFVRITWDEALSTIATTITSAKDQYGPYIGFDGSYGIGSTLFTYYGINVSTIGNVSQGNGMSAQGDTMGDPNTSAGSGSSFDNLQSSKLIVCWAFDVTTGMISKRAMYWMELAHEMGIPVIAIDPKLTMTANSIADQWIPIRPGTDIAMMLAIANVLFTQNLYDTSFVSKYVEPTGFAKWEDYVLGNTAGPDGAINRTPEWAESICGVPAATITALATLLASSKPAFLYFGWGGMREARGIQPAKTSIYLNAMLGNIGQLGGWPGQGGLGASLTNSIGAPAVDFGATPITTLSPYSDYSTSPSLFAYNQLAEAILLAPQYNSGQITKEQFYSTIGCNSSYPAPNIQVVMTLGAHPMGTSIPDTNKLVSAIPVLSIFVQGDRHWTASARLADIVLPLTQMYEEESQFMSIKRGFVYIPNLMPPPGETRSPTWINVQLANLWGIGAQYNPVMQNVSWDDWNSTMDSLNQTAYETWAQATATQSMLGYTPPSWSDFLKQPVIRLESAATPMVAFSAQISGGQPFLTKTSPISDLKSGLIEFYDSIYEEFDISKIFGYGYIAGGWCYCAPTTPMAEYQVPEESYFDSRTTQYPFVLLGNQHNKHIWQGMGLQNPAIYGEFVTNAVWISVSDAKAIGIGNGDLVHVYNDRGSAVLPAYVTSTIIPGTVQMWRVDFAPQGGYDRGGAVNGLLGQPITATPTGMEAGNALVQVEKFVE